jgi:hypothetical protein
MEERVVLPKADWHVVVAVYSYCRVGAECFPAAGKLCMDPNPNSHTAQYSLILLRTFAAAILCHRLFMHKF